MSEAATVATVAKHLSHVEFHRVCKAMMQNEGEFRTVAYSREQACARLKELTGIVVSERTLRDLYEATGIEPAKKAKAPGHRPSRDNWKATRSLAVALRAIYMRLGEPIPKGLQSVCDMYTAKDAADEAAT